MSKSFLLSLIVLLSLPLLFSCYYDNQEFLYPEVGNSCDTTNVTFNTGVKSLMQNRCWSCHSNATASSAGGGIRLQDYVEVSSQSTRILGVIKHQSGFSPMPKNSGMLPPCSIRQFEIWISTGKGQ